MNFLDPELDAYVTAHTEPEPAHLRELNRETYLKVLQPRMLSGHLQGRVLSMLTHLIRPNNILEIGTYTGYSAICMAEGLSENGHIHTIDINEELQPIVQKYIHLTGNADRITIHIGDAMEIIPSLNIAFDMVFIDADKTNYLNYYHLIFDRLPIGAVIIADNVLWSGKVLDLTEVEEDPDTAALVAFNTWVTNDKRVENVLLTIRDGLMVIRKTSN
jgi:predicted O-methyltransferase YrrM